jgi:hypothetical protein
MHALFISLIVIIGLYNSSPPHRAPIEDSTVVDSIKTLYKQVSTKSVKLKDHDAVKQMLHSKQADTIRLPEVVKIKRYLFEGKPNKESIKPLFNFEIWIFDNPTLAKQGFDIMKRRYEDKPPKGFFLYGRKLYYFSAGSAYIYLEYVRKAYSKALACFGRGRKIDQVTY